MIASGLPDATDHARKPVNTTKLTKATAKSGRANKLNYPIGRKKTSQNGRKMAHIRGWKGLSGAIWVLFCVLVLRPFFTLLFILFSRFTQ
ncbi:hypothetical protein [Paraburkholderia caffeinilytica]|uniref:hypothetical protein n=1 Tax=Paraburkholderia caffeinilytica TaxID=1761016 RepID=UPI0038B90FAA